MIRSLTMGVPIYSRSKQVLARQLDAFNGNDLVRLGQAHGIQARTVCLTLPVAPEEDYGHQPGALSSSTAYGILRMSWVRDGIACRLICCRRICAAPC